MSVGALLVQPQRLPRVVAADADQAGFGDLAVLAGGIVLDAVKGGHMLDTFEAAGEALGERFLAQAEHGLDHARERLADLLETPVAALQTKAGSLGAIDGPDGALAAAHDLLSAVVAIVEELTIDHIRQHLGELVDIVETDFALTPTFLEQQVWALLDDVVDRLEHVAPEADQSLRTNRIRVIGALRRMARRFRDEFELPELDVEQLSEELFAFIRGTGIPDGAARVACVGAGLAQVASSARDVLRVVPFTGLLPGSVGAGVTPDPPAGASETYLWYPSWLANNHRPWWVDLLLIVPGDEVVRSADRSQIVQRHMYGGADDTFALGPSGEWKDTPRLPGEDKGRYTFDSVSADALETLAWITSITTNGFELLFHLISLETGDYASNSVNAVSNLGFGLWKGFARKPFPNWLEGPVFRFLGTHLASFEGMHTKANTGNKFLMWLTLAGPDFAEMLVYRYFTNFVRDLLLSILTLVNNHPQPITVPPEKHSRNREEVDAMRDLIVHGFSNLYLFAFERKNWGVMKAGGSKSPMLELIFFWSLLGGIAAGGVGGLLGCTAAEGIAREIDNDTLVKKLWWGIPQAVAFAPLWLYLRTEGKTADGTFTPFGGAEFQGYPPASSSPYRLPYDSSAVGACYVGQGNQGLWSHNFNNVGQLYAYDFSLDQADEILAARGGTVVNFWESVPDDTDPGGGSTASTTLTTAIAINTAPATIDVVSTSGFATPGILQIGSDLAFYTSISGNTFLGVTWPGTGTTANYAGPVTGPPAVPGAGVFGRSYGWNFVAIRHDTAAPAHDKGQGGAPVTTVGVYGHGRTGSVSAAFSRHTPSVPTRSIIGTVVKQGMPIMDAGDTGISFHNHLHMHVVVDPGSNYANFGGSNSPGVTLPFVFSDVGGDGVPYHFNWYTSGNARILV